MSCVLDSDAETGPLAARAFQRLWFGFRPATLAPYRCIFRLLLAFLVVLDLSMHQISTMDILAFMQYLYESGMSPDNIVNHLTAVRSLSIIYACDTSAFRDHRIPIFIKSLKINRVFQPKIKLLVDEDLILRIVTVAHHLPNSQVFIPSFFHLFCFFSFIRLSNILPHAVYGFDATRHLCVWDVIFSDAGARVIIKWFKTIQDRVFSTTVNIPSLGASALCPIIPLRSMLASRQVHPDEPLFWLPVASQWLTLTDSRARKHLKEASKILDLPRSLTFHERRCHLGVFKRGAHRAYPDSGYLVLLMCMEVHFIAPLCCFPGCLYFSTTSYCLAYLYWVFGALFSLQTAVFLQPLQCYVLP